MRKTHGEDFKSWKWSDVHKLTFNHPLGGVIPDPLLLNRGPFKVGGNLHTINASFFNPYLNGFNMETGPTYRQIIDLGNLEESGFIVIPGISGNPQSLFYSNHIEKWLNGEYFPLLINKSKIDDQKSEEILLKKQ